jgi:hypothetical protein
MSRHHGVPALIAALSPPVRRFVALGGVVLTIALVVGWVVQPALLWSTTKVEAWADARFVMARAQAAARAVQGVSPAVVEEEEAEIRRFLLPGETEAEAAAANVPPAAIPGSVPLWAGVFHGLVNLEEFIHVD